jgi:hypothetical protein
VSSQALELIHSSLYVAILKEPFPKYPKKLKIRQCIEILLVERKEKFFQISLETVQTINTGI